jgi:hypothetical protein
MRIPAPKKRFSFLSLCEKPSFLCRIACIAYSLRFSVEETSCNRTMYDVHGNGNFREVIFRRCTNSKACFEK